MSEDSPISKPPAIQGSATVTPTAPPLAPVKATWTVNQEAKNATADLLGGTAVITRDPNTGKFQCVYNLEKPATETTEAVGVQQTFPLIDCPNLPAAQRRAETLIRENLGKTHPEVLEAATAGETAEEIAAAGPDPF